MTICTSLHDPKLAQMLCSGKIGVLPTDTVYGLVCMAVDKHAVQKLYALKQREAKPGTIIASSIEQLVSLGLKRRYLTAVSQFWPGPISVVIPTGNTELDYLDMAVKTIAVRIVDNQELERLLNKTGPLLTSSANTPGRPPANTMQEAIDYFHDSVDFYVDGGNQKGRQASTVIKIVDDAVEVLRHGAGKIIEK